MPLLNLDHVVLACADLERGTAWLEKALGVPLAPGGQHTGFGTHNRLLQLGGGVYMELIAPDPSQGAVTRSRPFELDRFAPEVPCLVSFVSNTANLDLALAQLFYVPGQATTMTRGDLSWKISVPEGGKLQNSGTWPTVIEWPLNVHPSKSLPHQGVRLERFVLAMDETSHSKFAAIFDDPRLVKLISARPWLGLELQTPNGRVFLNSPNAHSNIQ